MRGIYSVWKPKGPTSHDIINIIRKQTGEKRVGHAGTLDPLAEGVLVVAIGREWTKKLSEMVKKEKEYAAEIKLGEESSTDDEEGTKTRFNPPAGGLDSEFKAPEIEDIKKTLKMFTGKIKQVPPKFSAVKVKGISAYKLARHNVAVSLEPRDAEVKSAELISYEWPVLRVRFVTGPGVYIRSIARDIGRALGTGAYLSGLVRTRVWNFEEKNCKNIDFFREK